MGKGIVIAVVASSLGAALAWLLATGLPKDWLVHARQDGRYVLLADRNAATRMLQMDTQAGTRAGGAVTRSR